MQSIHCWRCSSRTIVEVEVGLDALGETLLGQRYDRLIHALVVRNDEGRGEHLQGSV